VDVCVGGRFSTAHVHGVSRGVVICWCDGDREWKGVVSSMGMSVLGAVTILCSGMHEHVLAVAGVADMRFMGFASAGDREYIRHVKAATVIEEFNFDHRKEIREALEVRVIIFLSLYHHSGSAKLTA
jgi:hypothetical protein